MRRASQYALFAMVVFGLTACEREDRQFRPGPPNAPIINTIQVSGVHPGGIPPQEPPVPNIYSEQAYAVSEGQRLYEQYNCVGCHAHGGGGMGPPLMDNKWIYGGSPANIFATIMEGRPNGMPSWRERIPEYQAWEIVAYVRSLSGQLAKDVAPGRSDHMQGKPSEQSTPEQVPTGVTGGPPEKTQ